jgi:hypothetical protein
LAAVAWPVTAAAQQPDHPPAHGHPTPATQDEGALDAHTQVAGEPSQFRMREASGTAWLPDVTPMYGLHDRSGAWELMLHGNGFVQFLHESAPEHRGASQLGSIN